MHRDLRQRTKEIKGRVAFNELFRQLFPNHYKQTGNSQCPFHDDGQASFQVSDDRGFCHAGCTPGNGAKSFDVVSLWMRAKRVNFKAAVKDLAESCGINQESRRVVKTYDYTDENGNLLFHTLGRRLRGADVPEEDRKDLLGHKQGRSITTHYSMAEIAELIAYSNRICREECHKSDTIVFPEKRNRQAGAA